MKLAIPALASVLFAFAVCGASAQTPSDATAPIEAKKPVAKKVDAKKSDARKPVAKKPEAKKATPAKPAPTATPQVTKVYTTGPPALRDKQGNVIPTNPEAYPVDSALPKKK